MQPISRKTSCSGSVGWKSATDVQSKSKFRPRTASRQEPCNPHEQPGCAQQCGPPHFTPHSCLCNMVVTILTKNGMRRIREHEKEPASCVARARPGCHRGSPKWNGAAKCCRRHFSLSNLFQVV